MAAAARIASLRATSAKDKASEGDAQPSVVARLGGGDRLAMVGLAVLFVAFAALSWKTWGNPQADFGVELTTADRLAHGAVLYDDIRYFYGPLGVYPLAGAFALFGSSFTVAFAFGLATALAIFAAFYALARTWLTPLFATAATAIAMAIGFSGTLFNYVAPHTTSATFGILAILLQLLALTRGRTVLAGVAAGAVVLTRPELAAVAFAIGAGFVLGRAMESGRRAALTDLARLFVPAALVPLLVFAPFLIDRGPGDLVFDQLIPLDMTRISGLRFQADWAPFDLTSVFALGMRSLVYVVLLAALAAASWRWHKRHGAWALLPLLAGIAGLLALDAAAHVLGAFSGTTGIVQTEAKRMLLGMSWLPFVVVGVGIWALVRARQARLAPITGSWPLDLALIGGSLILAGRAYNRFTTDTYAAYYAPLLVLLAVILHQKIATRWPGARAGVLLALGAVFVGLSWSALTKGSAASDEYTLCTPRGCYMAPANSGAAYGQALEIVRQRSEPGDPILALPLEGGLPFAADRPPALRELQLLPGVVDSRADEREAIETLKRRDVRIVVLGNTRFDAWGYPVIGTDYNRRLIDYIRGNYIQVAELGDFADAPEGQIFSTAYRVYELRD